MLMEIYNCSETKSKRFFASNKKKAGISTNLNVMLWVGKGSKFPSSFGMYDQ